MIGDGSHMDSKCLPSWVEINLQRSRGDIVIYLALLVVLLDCTPYVLGARRAKDPAWSLQCRGGKKEGSWYRSDGCERKGLDRGWLHREQDGG